MKQGMRNLVWNVLLIVLVMSLTACGGGGGGSENSASPEGTMKGTIGSSGGTLASSDGKIKLEVPSGSLDDGTVVEIADTGERGEITTIYMITVSDDTFEKPIKVVLSYEPSSLPPNSSEEDLFLYTWDEDGYVETLTDISVDTANHLVSGYATHFSPITAGVNVQTVVKVSDLPITRDFRFPIGDIGDDASNGSKDLGGNISFLSIDAYSNRYPKVGFNLSASSNRWQVGTAYNKKDYITNYGSGSIACYSNTCTVYHPGEDWNRIDEDDLGMHIHAVANGRVVYKRNDDGSKKGFGNIIVITHKLSNKEVVFSVYGHMREASPKNVGDLVTKGDIIGHIGTTGNSTGPHLHFEITKQNRVPIDSNGVIKAPTSGWYWPITKKNVDTYYYDPSYFIKNINGNNRWEFKINDNTDSWMAVNAESISVDKTANDNGLLTLDPMSSDPQIITSPLNINASDYNIISISMATKASDTSASLFFKTLADDMYTAGKRIDFTVNNDGLFHTYDLTVNPSTWSGTITGLRLDPMSSGVTGSNTDKVIIDYIKLVNKATSTTYSVSGKVILNNGSGLSGVSVACSGSTSPATTDEDGTYAFNSLVNGTYTLSFSRNGYSFNPATVSVSVSNGNMVVSDVTATAIDSDNDGIDNLTEILLGTNPNDADSDDDGIIDGAEDTNYNGVVDIWETDPTKIDTDGDGIQDGTELGITTEQIGSDTDTTIFQPDLDPTTTTSAISADTDGDGISDGVEDTNHNGRVDAGEGNPNSPNQPPVANAGADQTVAPNATVTLNGTKSTDPENWITTYLWQQTSGPTVTIINTDTANPQFTAAVAAGSTLIFSLTVTDSGGLKSMDTCVVKVYASTDPITNLLNSLVTLPDGSFQMGSLESNNYQPVHTVSLSSFEIGSFEITQAQYLAVMGTNPSENQGDGKDSFPVENVSWYNAREFCARLSAMTGRIFTLPSEAQWEYACRAGSTTRYSFGDDDAQLINYAWYDNNSGMHSNMVGTKLPNAWGLYDMHGNVFEWCLDSWHGTYADAPTDGSAWEPDIGLLRIIRGGRFNDVDRVCLSASRAAVEPGYGRNETGFRVVAIPTLNAGLVAYYPFNGSAKDESGNGNHGTIYGAVSTADRFNHADSAYAFDGVNDYIDCGNQPTVNITGPLTLAAWVYVESLKDERIISKWGLYSGYELDIAYGTNSYLLRFNINQYSDPVYALSGIENQWMFLTATWNGAVKKLYVNGELKGTLNTTYVDIAVSTYNLRIGAMSNGAPAFFGGKIDSIRIYNRALSDFEISSLYCLNE